MAVNVIPEPTTNLLIVLAGGLFLVARKLLQYAYVLGKANRPAAAVFPARGGPVLADGIPVLSGQRIEADALAVGIFADGTYGGVEGLITGKVGQLLLQVVDVAAVIAWVGVTAFLTFWVIKRTIGLRASRKEELQGLDLPEHGIEAYPVDEPVATPGVATT